MSGHGWRSVPSSGDETQILRPYLAARNRSELTYGCTDLRLLPALRKVCAMTKPSLEDRASIEDLYADYVWALDSGNVEAFLKLFTANGVFGDTAGNRYKGHDAIRGYVSGLAARPEFRGRQHIISSLRFAPDGDRVGVTAFWHVFKWVKATGTKTVEVTGHSDDMIVKNGGRWLFSRRLVHYWNDTDLPWVGPPAKHQS